MSLLLPTRHSQPSFKEFDAFWSVKGKRKLSDLVLDVDSFMSTKKIILPSQLEVEPTAMTPTPDSIVSILSRSKNALAASRRSQTRHRNMQKAIREVELARAADPFFWNSDLAGGGD